ncbi:MAG: hypothetical protein ACK4NM_19275, partial [Hydrogenophaga sp.]
GEAAVQRALQRGGWQERLLHAARWEHAAEGAKALPAAHHGGGRGQSDRRGGRGADCTSRSVSAVAVAVAVAVAAAAAVGSAQQARGAPRDGAVTVSA